MRTYSIMFRGWDPHIHASHTTTSEDGTGQRRIPTDGADAGNMAQLVAAVLTAVSPAPTAAAAGKSAATTPPSGLSEEIADESI
jgi:hypothetical protein